MTGQNVTFDTYGQFWPFYLVQHRQRLTRLLHVAGTAAALVLIVLAITEGDFLLLALAPVAGYGAAWIAHAMIEKNRPATFSHPLWSLAGDFHMLGLWLSGRLETVLVQHKILT